MLLLLSLLALVVTASGLYNKCTYHGAKGRRSCDGYAAQVILGATCVGLLLGEAFVRGGDSSGGDDGMSEEE